MCVSYTSFKALPSNKLTGEATFVIPTVISHMSYHSRFKLELIKMSQNKRQLDVPGEGRRWKRGIKRNILANIGGAFHVAPFPLIAPRRQSASLLIDSDLLWFGLEWSGVEAGGGGAGIALRTVPDARRPHRLPIAIHGVRTVTGKSA